MILSAAGRSGLTCCRLSAEAPVRGIRISIVRMTLKKSGTGLTTESAIQQVAGRLSAESMCLNRISECDTGTRTSAGNAFCHHAMRFFQIRLCRTFHTAGFRRSAFCDRDVESDFKSPAQRKWEWVLLWIFNFQTLAIQCNSITKGDPELLFF